MKRFIFLATSIPLWGCGLMGESDCVEGTFSPFGAASKCDGRVESALDELVFAERDIVELQPPFVSLGTHEGEVIDLGPRRVEFDISGARLTLRWHRDLPFSIERGETMLLQVDKESASLFFEQGALAFHVRGAKRPPPSKVQMIGKHEVRWEEGCDSSYGKAMNLVVGDKLVPPGSAVAYEGWKVENLGATFTEGGKHCGASTPRPYMGAWIAESTELGYRCFHHQTAEPACSEEIDRAVEEGRAHYLGHIGAPEGQYVVTSVEPEGFGFGHAGSMPLVLNWPGPLPFELQVGNQLGLNRVGDWMVFNFPLGRLALAGIMDSHTQPPEVSPDAKATLERHGACGLGDTLNSIGIRIEDDEESAIIFSGEEAQVGNWTYLLLHSRELEPSFCEQGQELLWVAEGKAEYRLLAYQIYPDSAW